MYLLVKSLEYLQASTVPGDTVLGPYKAPVYESKISRSSPIICTLGILIGGLGAGKSRGCFSE